MVMAPTDEFHEVEVPQSTNDLNFRGVLFPPLGGAPGHSFYGNVEVQCVDEASVYRTKAALSKLPIVREVASGSS